MKDWWNKFRYVEFEIVHTLSGPKNKLYVKESHLDPFHPSLRVHYGYNYQGHRVKRTVSEFSQEEGNEN